ncbi:MAG: PAS sensor protein, partial [Candidatus Dadabacteria bacterium]
MAPANVKLINEPRDFKDHELFFSLTDKKAIIKYGNHVFWRVAAYEETELFDKPHNTIRHPDMPRAAFKIVWDKLLSDQHVFAYVKNLAKDGRYYWVIAAILPTQNGYLSILIKPSSDLFDKIPEIYSQIRKKELAIEEKDSRKRKEAISEGIKELQEILSQLG